MSIKQIRNIAIIAHVDHGKTTMVDQLLRQSGTFAEHEKVVDTVMDNNAIEKERGITILAKNCAVTWEGTHINIVDTPGHADFGGEVERALSMVDGVVLLIDAQEGPMPQTRFVTKKALALGLKPILVVNKVDKPGARPDFVVNAAFDLFDKLGATDEQLDFPVVYASGINGWSSMEEGEAGEQWGPDMSALFNTVLQHVPAQKGDPDAPLQLQISALDFSTFVGRIGVGRISQGTVRPMMDVVVMEGPDGKVVKGRVNQVLTFQGLERVQATEAGPGEIVLINGLTDIGIGVTVTDAISPAPLPMLKVDEPTLTMNFCVNTSPLAGREGKYITSRQIWDRLQKELQHNVALRVKETELTHDHFDAFEHVLAGLRDPFEAFAVSGEDVHTQLFFELDDGLGDARLRGMQGLGSFCQIEVAARGLLDEAKLMQVHNKYGQKSGFIMPLQSKESLR